MLCPISERINHFDIIHLFLDAVSDIHHSVGLHFYTFKKCSFTILKCEQRYRTNAEVRKV